MWPKKHGYTNKQTKNPYCLICNEFAPCSHNCVIDECVSAIKGITVDELAIIIHEAYWPNSKFDEANEIDINSAINVAQAIHTRLLAVVGEEPKP